MIVVIGDPMTDIDFYVEEADNYEGGITYKPLSMKTLSGGSKLLCHLIHKCFGEEVRFFHCDAKDHTKKFRYFVDGVYHHRYDTDVYYDEYQQNVLIDELRTQRSLLARADCVVLSDYSRGSATRKVRDAYYGLDLKRYTISTARDCYDPLADLWVVNQRELVAVLEEGMPVPQQESQTVVITQGARGVAFRERKKWEEETISPSISQSNVKSVIGAGDAFVAYLAVHREDFKGAQAFAEEYVQNDRMQLAEELS